MRYTERYIQTDLLYTKRDIQIYIYREICTDIYIYREIYTERYRPIQRDIQSGIQRDIVMDVSFSCLL